MNTLAVGVAFSLLFAPQIDINPTPTMHTEIVSAAVDGATLEYIVSDITTKPIYLDYDEQDLYWLSRLIYAECGSDSCSDELQLAVGSVVLNRAMSEIYPNTIHDVIFDTHWGRQYGCTRGAIYKEPNERAVKNAKHLLTYGPTIPSDVLAQDNKVHWNNHYKTIQGVVFSRWR